MSSAINMLLHDLNYEKVLILSLMSTMKYESVLRVTQKYSGHSENFQKFSLKAK